MYSKCKLEIAEKVLLTPKRTSFIVPVRFVNLPRVRFVISLRKCKLAAVVTLGDSSLATSICFFWPTGPKAISEWASDHSAWLSS